MMLHCIIIEDEPLAAEKLEAFVKKVPYLKLMESFRSSLSGLQYLKEHKVDLVFLDIQMDELTGIELLESLSKKPFIIMTTAYQEYALKGYELHVSDYLLKPFDFTRFMKAVDKVYDEHSIRIGSTTSSQDCIFVKTEYRIEKLLLDNILYIEGMSDYLRIHTSDQKQIMCLQTFRSFEQVLPPHRFQRVHKSYLVAIDKISSIEKMSMKIGDKRIPISNSYKDSFFELIKKRGLL